MSEKAEHVSERRPRLLLVVARWSVPIVYALVSVCLARDMWEQRARQRLADEVAAIVREAAPSTLAELIGRLGDRAGTVHRRRLETADGPVQGANVELVPSVWLRLSAELAADDESLERVRLIYADSEELPLENPRAAIPNVSAAHGILIAFAVGLAALWHASASALRPKTRLHAAGAIASAAPLLVYVPLGLISLARTLLA